MPLGAAAGGLLAAGLGLRGAVVVAAVAVPFAAIAVLLSAVRRLRVMPTIGSAVTGGVRGLACQPANSPEGVYRG
jgi:hypothetical protein